VENAGEYIRENIRNVAIIAHVDHAENNPCGRNAETKRYIQRK